MSTKKTRTQTSPFTPQAHAAIARMSPDDQAHLVTLASFMAHHKAPPAPWLTREQQEAAARSRAEFAAQEAASAAQREAEREARSLAFRRSRITTIKQRVEGAQQRLLLAQAAVRGSDGAPSESFMDYLDVFLGEIWGELQTLADLPDELGNQFAPDELERRLLETAGAATDARESVTREISSERTGAR